MSYLTILILGSIGMLLLTCGISIFIFLFQRKLIKRKLAYHEISELLKKQELQSTYAILQGQEQERKRIAEDLHDNLGSVLATMTMYADALVSKCKDDQARSIAEGIRGLAGTASEEIRSMSHSLYSGMLKHFGLKSAILDLMDAIREAKSMDVEVFIEIGDELPNDVVLHLYRIVQELLQNTLKHAKAQKIRLEITEFHQESINLIYEDNGCGFQVSEKEDSGMGLSNIRSRVSRLKGQFMIQSSSDHGTSIVIEIPVEYEN